LSKPTIYTIGHSLHTLDAFLALLRLHAIGAVGDVRTLPRSGRAPQFNREPLARALKTEGFAYVYLGAELGGRPQCEAYYTEKGHARYDLMAKDSLFLAGIERLLVGCAKYRIALMCSEGDACICHRHNLIAPILAERGVDVFHILKDGGLSKYGAGTLMIPSLGNSPKPVRPKPVS